MARVDRLGDFAFDLESGEEGLEEGTARHTEPFADGQRGGEHRHGRMRQQSEHAIRSGGELRVVVVHRMAARRVGERGLRGRSGRFPRAEDRRVAETINIFYGSWGPIATRNCAAPNIGLIGRGR